MPTDDPIARWHDYMHAPTPEGLSAMLHEGCVFQSPAVHTPQKGKALTMKYLLAAAQALGGPAFRYVGEWRADRGAVLEFENVIDGIKLNGVDIITFADDGRITNFKVMVRPLKAINLLHRLMGEQLARQ